MIDVPQLVLKTQLQGEWLGDNTPYYLAFHDDSQASNLSPTFRHGFLRDKILTDQTKEMAALDSVLFPPLKRFQLQHDTLWIYEQADSIKPWGIVSWEQASLHIRMMDGYFGPGTKGLLFSKAISDTSRNIEKIQLATSTCYWGECPSFEVEVTPQHIIFNGKENIHPLGLYIGPYPVERFQRLANVLRSANIKQRWPKYRRNSLISDSWYQDFTIIHNNGIHEWVTFDDDIPGELLPIFIELINIHEFVSLTPSDSTIAFCTREQGGTLNEWLAFEEQRSPEKYRQAQYLGGDAALRNDILNRVQPNITQAGWESWSFQAKIDSTGNFKNIERFHRCRSSESDGTMSDSLIVAGIEKALQSGPQ